MGNNLNKQYALKHGDIQSICDVTGFSESYVKKVLRGERNNQKIHAAAKKIINSRKEIKLALSKESK